MVTSELVQTYDRLYGPVGLWKVFFIAGVSAAFLH